MLNPRGGKVDKHPAAAEAMFGKVRRHDRVEFADATALGSAAHDPPDRSHVHVLEIRQDAPGRQQPEVAVVNLTNQVASVVKKLNVGC